MMGEPGFFSDLLGGLLQPVAQKPSVFDQALQQYPILKQYGIQSTNGPAGGNVLESWPPGEPGAADTVRPKDLPIDKFGVEIGPNAKPIDVLADVVSHHLINVDPKIKQVYSTFKNSLTPQQEGILQDQYDYAKQNGEKRSYAAWKENSGIPAYFRGHPFGQWPAQFNQRAYTPQQMQLLDGMMRYLQGQQ